MTMLCLARHFEAYDKPVHLSFTMMLAERAGFAREDAFELAKYDQATDDDPATQPYTRDTQQRRDYHFAQDREREARRRAAFACNRQSWDVASYRAAGQYLHMIEDGFSHGNSAFAMSASAKVLPSSQPSTLK